MLILVRNGMLVALLIFPSLRRAENLRRANILPTNNQTAIPHPIPFHSISQAPCLLMKYAQFVSLIDCRSST